LNARFVEDLGLTHFDVLGMSSGAPYCYAIGSRFPEKARNLFIFSGIPALFDHEIQTHWPFDVKANASIREMQQLARGLFFSNLTEEDLCKDEIKDSMSHDCFGIGLDFRLRGMDWGFKLEDLKQTVLIRHARFDPAVPFITAELTSRMLSNCSLFVEENEIHFSEAAISVFFQSVIIPRLI
jgi:pimeloyl-ACP methyl ester carboxylesterase